MTEMLAITTLRTKRAEIADALEGLGRQVEQRRTDLMHLDATLRLFDPDAEAAPGQAAVAGALDDAPAMHGDGGIDQIAAQRPEPRQNAIPVGPRESAVPDDVRTENRRDLPGLAHRPRPFRDAE